MSGSIDIISLPRWQCLPFSGAMVWDMAYFHVPNWLLAAHARWVDICTSQIIYLFYCFFLSFEHSKWTEGRSRLMSLFAGCVRIVFVCQVSCIFMYLCMEARTWSAYIVYVLWALSKAETILYINCVSATMCERGSARLENLFFSVLYNCMCRNGQKQNEKKKKRPHHAYRILFRSWVPSMLYIILLK